MKNRILSFVAVLVFFSSSYAFSKQDDSGMDGNAFALLSWEVLRGKQTELALNYTLATVAMAKAQAKLAAALDLKEDAEKLEAEAKALEANSTVDTINNISSKQLKNINKLSKSTRKNLNEALEKKGEITGEQRKNFLKGFASYAVSVHTTIQAFEEFKPFMSGLWVKAEQTVTASQAGDTSAVIDIFAGRKAIDIVSDFNLASRIVKTAPNLLVNHGKTSKNLYDYTNQHGIKVPDNATAELDAVMGFKKEGGRFGGGMLGSLGKNLAKTAGKVVDGAIEKLD